MHSFYRNTQDTSFSAQPARIRQDRHAIDSAFTFLLLLVFMMFTLLLAAMGSSIYRNGVTYLDENYTTRTAVAYVSEKVRQHDESGCIFLTTIEDLPALALRDEIDGESYLTYIYYYEGALRELFVREDREALAAMGSEIVALASLSIEETDSADGVPMLSVTAASEAGNELSLLIHYQSESAEQDRMERNLS